uniref:Uncharacterized protein n=1 Tax=Helianthus annuus TaxID=4232 RepID=A0A251UL48_HELAN
MWIGSSDPLLFKNCLLIILGPGHFDFGNRPLIRFPSDHHTHGYVLLQAWTNPPLVTSPFSFTVTPRKAPPA